MTAHCGAEYKNGQRPLLLQPLNQGLCYCETTKPGSSTRPGTNRLLLCAGGRGVKRRKLAIYCARVNPRSGRPKKRPVVNAPQALVKGLIYQLGGGSLDISVRAGDVSWWESSGQLAR